jgi:hypothetical protein
MAAIDKSFCVERRDIAGCADAGQIVLSRRERLRFHPGTGLNFDRKNLLRILPIREN